MNDFTQDKARIVFLHGFTELDFNKQINILVFIILWRIIFIARISNLRLKFKVFNSLIEYLKVWSLVQQLRSNYLICRIIKEWIKTRINSPVLLSCIYHLLSNQFDIKILRFSLNKTRPTYLKLQNFVTLRMNLRTPLIILMLENVIIIKFVHGWRLA